ncbi:MAG: DNA polymerase/3'-5' exonuclease PolX [Deltaproteobacteria bacterium]|nr:DNA polymerase/3'-5' exonuclease PolX [Deltaproteobacteria bacterium]
MKATKNEVIRILDQIAVLLELKGENPFKSRAYESAARNIEQTDEDFERIIEENRLSTIKGIGDAISKKIRELAETGSLAYYENLRASVPEGHLEMLRIPGLGPKKIRTLHEKLGIEEIGELEYACHENRLVDLSGFGEKTQKKILAGIEHLKRYREKRLYAEAIEEAEALLALILQRPEATEASLAGSLRRRCEIVKDIDLLAASAQPQTLAEWFTALPQVESVTARGETKVSIVLKSGINADLRIVKAGEYPYALHHFTGSREHNTAMRGRAKRMGIKMNEYGLYAPEGNIACKSEAEVFAALGLPFIPPELREDMGEIEAAERGTLPGLIDRRDIRGLFHIHTRMSDGADTLEAIAAEAKAMGLDYIGISDHSQAAYYAGGLSREDIVKQSDIIDALNEKESSFHIFKGIEADILPEGRLDYDDETLERFDFVIAAVHSHFGMSEGEMTNRILKALGNPFTTMLAHPSGRLLLAREAYAVDLQAVIDFAAERGKVLEINANPQRLDLDWRLCPYAKRRKALIALNPDAHNLEGLRYIEYGLHIARKGWLESGDCLNCLALEEIKAFLSHG